MKRIPSSPQTRRSGGGRSMTLAIVIAFTLGGVAAGGTPPGPDSDATEMLTPSHRRILEAIQGRSSDGSGDPILDGVLDVIRSRKSAAPRADATDDQDAGGDQDAGRDQDAGALSDPPMSLPEPRGDDLPVPSSPTLAPAATDPPTLRWLPDEAAGAAVTDLDAELAESLLRTARLLQRRRGTLQQADELIARLRAAAAELLAPTLAP